MTEEIDLFDAQDAKELLQGAERRIAVRYASTQERSGRSIITSIKDGVDTAWFGTIRDASSSGIAIGISRPFEPGALLVVELVTVRKGLLRLPVRVVHCRPDEKERWVIGCAFVTPGSDRDGVPTGPSTAFAADAASRHPQ